MGLTKDDNMEVFGRRSILIFERKRTAFVCAERILAD